MEYIVTCMVKNYRFIFDWCKHHIQLGFDKCIIVNNGLTQEQLDSISGFDQIEIIDYQCEIPVQLDAVQMAIDRCPEDSWIALIDSDEFIWCNELSIQQFLSKFPNDCGAVELYWMYYESGLPWITSLSQCRPIYFPEPAFGKRSYRIRQKEIIKKSALKLPITSVHHNRVTDDYYHYDQSGIRLNQDPDNNTLMPLANYSEAWIQHYRYASYYDGKVKFELGLNNLNGKIKANGANYKLYPFFLNNESDLYNSNGLFGKDPDFMMSLIEWNSDEIWEINDLQTFKWAVIILLGKDDWFTFKCDNFDYINRLRVLGETYNKHFILYNNGTYN